jgi:hypothetical protein
MKFSRKSEAGALYGARFLAYRLERASEPNGSRARFVCLVQRGEGLFASFE